MLTSPMEPAPPRARTSAGRTRGWMKHGIAALGVSALGLAVAGSVALTTSAQSTTESDSDTVTLQAVPLKTVQVAIPAPQTGTAEEQEKVVPAAFSRRADQDASRDQVRMSRVQEQAEQRLTELSKSQLAVVEQSRSSIAKERTNALAQTALATRERQIKIMQEQQAASDRDKALATALQSNQTQTTQNQSSTTTVPSSPEIDTTAVSSSGGARPIAGGVITAQFGAVGSWSRYHTGADFRAAYGTTIRAAQDGVVVIAGNKGDWAGNHVAIRHADGKTSMAAHMSTVAVSVGQTVKAGQTIGYVGSTGRAFGAHLHFELYPAGVQPGDVYRAINPQPWLVSIGAG